MRPRARDEDPDADKKETENRESDRDPNQTFLQHCIAFGLTFTILAAGDKKNIYFEKIPTQTKMRSVSRL